MRVVAVAAAVLMVHGVSAQTPGAVVTLSGLTSRAPADWKPQPVTGQFRHAQFLLPRAGGDVADAELIVFHFGAGGGGGAAANIERWKGMFENPTVTTDEFVVAGAKVSYVDLTGTYLQRTRSFDPNETPQPQPNTRMIAVVFDNAGGPYYLRLVGPAKTVSHHKAAFDAWLKGFSSSAR